LTFYPDHGDFILITPSRSGNGGGFVMLGRSDGVLNPGGIRFGPTDIYAVLENPAFAQRGVEETLAVGLLVEDGSDEKVILFVKMREGVELDAELEKLIKSSIRSARSARHVPARIATVNDVPMTLTGKKIEGEWSSRAVVGPRPRSGQISGVQATLTRTSAHPQGHQWRARLGHQPRDTAQPRVPERVRQARRGAACRRGCHQDIVVKHASVSYILTQAFFVTVVAEDKNEDIALDSCKRYVS
jgi:hypothetical protein